MKFYLKTIFSVLAFVTHSFAKSVNSGCFSGNKKIDVFCQYIGCSKQPFRGQYDEPIIIKHINNQKQEKVNFVCSSQTQSNTINYNIVTSNQDNEFLIPISISNNKQFWYSPPVTPTLGHINITFDNLNALDTNDHIVIVRQDLSVYCEILINHISNSHTYNVVTEPSNDTYMVRVSLYNYDKNDYPSCPTPENPLCENCHKIHIQNHTLTNAPYHLRQSPRHILVYEDTLNMRIVNGLA